MNWDIILLKSLKLKLTLNNMIRDINTVSQNISLLLQIKQKMVPMNVGVDEAFTYSSTLHVESFPWEDLIPTFP